MINLLSILIVFFALQGCSTAMSKGLWPETNQFGHPYSGIVVWSQVSCTPKDGKKNEDSIADSVSQNSKMLDAFFFTIIGVPTFVLWVIDLPLTLVADTVLVPIDLAIEPTEPRVTRCA